MTILETSRLSLHEFEKSDAPFLLEVMNQPDYHRYIGDRGLRTIVEAQIYIDENFISSYIKTGFGFWLLRDKITSEPLGFAGLVLRDELDQPDVGYAIHETYAGNGYAEEATRGILKYSHETLKILSLLAITDPDHTVSINVLQKCGFTFQRREQVFADGGELNVYKIELS